MLTIDHTNRITAKEAIQHSFFEDVREQVLSEVPSYNLHSSLYEDPIF